MPSSPFASGRASPLPSFTPPRSSPSVGLLASLEPSLSGAVAEKMALSYRTSRGWFLPRYLRGQFTPLQLGLSRRGTLSVPVLKCLHPARDTRILRGAPSNGPASPRYSVCSIVRALGGTALALVVALMVLVALIRGIVPFRGSLPFQGDATTLVLTPDEVERVWLWEIASGRYPSKREVPIELGTKSSNLARGVIPGRRSRIDNPARPKDAQSDAKQVDGLENVEGIRSLAAAAGVKPSWAAMEATIVPVGPPRSYVSLQRSRAPGAGAQTVHGSDTSYPPRPFPNSVLDLDAVMDHCDFSHGEYVRDCLEVLRSNAGLDQGLRRGRDASWRTTFLPRLDPSTTDNRVGVTERATNSLERQSRDMTSLLNSTLFSSILSTRLQLTLASNPEAFTAHESHPTADKSCDPDHPRIFHIFWAGPFTDKPYSAALSFLYTQRLGLERPIGSQTDTAVCRPQLWIWINPGPASSLPDPQARQTMLRDLAKNPWSSPFLHRRFQDNIKFKLWNTTEQLDGVREMDGWRDMRLFNSGGVKYGTDTPPRPQGVKVGRDERVLSETAAAGVELSDTANDNIVAGAEAEQARVLGPVDMLTSKGSTNDTLPPREKSKNEQFDRVGSTSSSGYDRLSVVLSDMARFVLTHRFGGVYLDADTILLRDWEELWGWNGAFAYRWSRLEKYNTAVLKMGRGSAIGNLIFRSAVANGLDFHPMTVSRYTKDAQVEGLLLRLPDALFDPAWLNTEYYQRDRPPFPYFKQFEDFFQTPKDSSAAPLSLGFDGFFKGAFSYHFHNFWWIPFDASRNFPDLGVRFDAGERVARGRLLAAKLATQSPVPSTTSRNHPSGNAPSPTRPERLLRPAGPREALSEAADVPRARWGDDERDFEQLDWTDETVESDERDLSWSTVLKRTFEAFVRGDRANLYGEMISWKED